MKKSDFKILLDQYSAATQNNHSWSCKVFGRLRCIQASLLHVYTHDMHKLNDDDIIGKELAKKIAKISDETLPAANATPESVVALDLIHDKATAVYLGMNEDEEESNTSSLTTGSNAQQ